MQNLTITIMNELKNTGQQQLQFDVAGLLPGVYFVRVQHENFIETVKIIKQ